jgi:phage terminase small subunit
MAKLSPKQEQFCREYLIDLNATQAALRAGYSAKTAYSQGQRLLKDVEVQACVQKLKDARAERTDITADKVLKELALIGFSNMADYAKWGGEGACFYDSDELTKEQSAAVAEVSSKKTTYRGKDDDEKETVEIKLKLHDKKGALVDIGRHLGMFKDKVEHSGKVEHDFGGAKDELAARLQRFVEAATGS